MSLVIVYLLSTIVYYSSAFTGTIYVGSINSIGAVPYSINSSSYIPLLINIIIVFFALLNENNKLFYHEKKEIVNEKQIIKIFMSFVFLLSIFLSLKYNIFTRSSFDKTELAESSDALTTYFKYLASFAFVYMYTKENIEYPFFWKLIATVPIFVTFLFGNRSFLIISILTVVFCHSVRHCYTKKRSVLDYIINNKKIFFGIIFLFCITLLIKGIYSALFIGDFELVASRIGESAYYQQIIYVSEPNTIMTNLDSIVSKDFKIYPSSYLALWAYFIPFMTGLIEDWLGVASFTLEYQKVVYASEGVTNRASTYIGETYANGGFIMSFIVISLYVLFLIFIFKKILKCHNNISMTTFLLIGIDGAFYIQRNSMAFEISRFRSYIYICLFIYLLAYFFNKDNKVFKK